jgi:TrmH family RNA methyltransferase
MIITSDKNPKIKNLVKLSEKSRERKMQKKFIVEGVQENFYALQNHFFPLEFYVQQEIFQSALELPSAEVYEVSQEVYQKIAYRKITEGIMGVYQYPNQNLADIRLSENAFVLVVESVEKPGNLGAICRTADALGVSMVILCEEKADIYNPNAIRASVGSVFNIPIFSAKNEVVYQFLKLNKIMVYSTYMDKSAIYLQDIDLTCSCSVIFGTEHSGVSSFWKDKISSNILIPMAGKIDSLNVSNAVAIVCYEVLRQKRTTK